MTERLGWEKLGLRSGEDFFGPEKARNLNTSVFFTVGRVDDVDHHVRSEVTAKSALWRLAGISRSEQIADLAHDIITLEGHDDHGTRCHELLNLRIKRLGSHVRVMFAQQSGRETCHLAADDGEAGFFEAIDHRSDVLLIHAIGFKDNKGFLHTGGS